MKIQMRWRKNWNADLRLCARTGVGVRTRIQIGKTHTTCTKCQGGFQICGLGTDKQSVLVC